MLHTHYGFLKLTVYDNTVGYDDYVIKNNLVVMVVKRSQSVSKPSNRICLAGAGTVLNQVVQCGAILLYTGQCFTNNIKLMISRENQILCTLNLAGFFVNLFLNLNENEFAD